MMGPPNVDPPETSATGVGAPKLPAMPPAVPPSKVRVGVPPNPPAAVAGSVFRLSVVVPPISVAALVLGSALLPTELAVVVAVLVVVIKVCRVCVASISVATEVAVNATPPIVTPPTAVSLPSQATQLPPRISRLPLVAEMPTPAPLIAMPAVLSVTLPPDRGAFTLSVPLVLILSTPLVAKLLFTAREVAFKVKLPTLVSVDRSIHRDRARVKDEFRRKNIIQFGIRQAKSRQAQTHAHRAPRHVV